MPCWRSSATEPSPPPLSRWERGFEACRVKGFTASQVLQSQSGETSKPAGSGSIGAGKLEAPPPAGEGLGRGYGEGKALAAAARHALSEASALADSDSASRSFGIRQALTRKRSMPCWRSSATVPSPSPLSLRERGFKACEGGKALPERASKSAGNGLQSRSGEGFKASRERLPSQWGMAAPVRLTPPRHHPRRTYSQSWPAHRRRSRPD